MVPAAAVLVTLSRPWGPSPRLLAMASPSRWPPPLRFRAASARTRSGGGYGLGLAIARSIVEGHHGRLTVTSTAAAGTTFTALLPRR